jgi:hypothetical protein
MLMRGGGGDTTFWQLMSSSTKVVSANVETLILVFLYMLLPDNDASMGDNAAQW